MGDSSVFMDERFQTLQRIIKIVRMLAFVHASAAAGMAKAAEPDHGPSSDAFSLATLEGLLDVRESGGSAGNGDDAQESGKFFFTRRKSGKREMCVDFNNLYSEMSGAELAAYKIYVPIVRASAMALFNKMKPCCHCDKENKFLKNLEQFAAKMYPRLGADAKT